MKLRAFSAAGIMLVLPVLSNCAAPGAVPAREPDVTGVVVMSGRQDGAALGQASDTYFEGMGLLRGNPVVVRGAGDERIEATDLEPGHEVQVWVGDTCAESYPVQCDVVALRVLP